MKTAEEYRAIIKAVFAMKLAGAEDEGPYTSNKWVSEEETAALNEGYVAGLRESFRVIEDSIFLLED